MSDNSIGNLENAKGKIQMAKKSKKKAAANKAALVASADQGTIAEAYNDELKKVFAAFHLQCISNTSEAEKNFTNGLTILRDARDRAMKLI